jgi:hypothetical protein
VGGSPTGAPRSFTPTGKPQATGLRFRPRVCHFSVDGSPLLETRSAPVNTRMRAIPAFVGSARPGQTLRTRDRQCVGSLPPRAGSSRLSEASATVHGIRSRAGGNAARRTARDDRRWILRFWSNQGVWQWLHPVQIWLDGTEWDIRVIARSADTGREYPPAPTSGRVQTHIRGDPVQPDSDRRATFESVVSPPRPQVGLLNQVLRLIG